MEDKIRIESSADLYKLPISTIKNTKLYNFTGKYYDKIYEEALKIERSGLKLDDSNCKGFTPNTNNTTNKLKYVELEINFNTEVKITI